MHLLGSGDPASSLRFPTQEGRVAWSLCNPGKASASLGLSSVCSLEALSRARAGTTGEAE